MCYSNSATEIQGSVQILMWTILRVYLKVRTRKCAGTQSDLNQESEGKSGKVLLVIKGQRKRRLKWKDNIHIEWIYHCRERWDVAYQTGKKKSMTCINVVGTRALNINDSVLFQSFIHMHQECVRTGAQPVALPLTAYW